MIFIIDNQGTTKAALYEPIYQGSNSANRIVLLAPFPNSSQCVAHFCLPNGITLDPVYLNTFANDVLETEKLNGWYRNIEYPITQYAGTVDVQFEITTTNGTIMSELTSFEVRKGNFKTPEVTEESISLYREILNAVTLYNSITTEAIKEVNDYVEEINSKTNNTDSRVGNLENEISIINSQVVPDIKINHIALTDDDNLNVFNQKGNKIASIYLPYERWKATAKHIVSSLDENYVLTISILTDTQEVISSTNIDLPIETLVTDATYKDGTLTLKLQNGTTRDVDLRDLLKGLTTDDTLSLDSTNPVQNKVITEKFNTYVEKATVRQEVDDSENPVSSKAVKEVTDELAIKYKTLENSPEPFPLENNTVYIAQAPITKLYVDLPTDNNYICSLTFEVGKDYDIRLYRDDGEVIYLKPLDFESGELWEINIMNNIVASGKVSRKVVSE